MSLQQTLTPIGKFKNKLNDMIDYLETIVPNDRDIEKYKMKLNTGLQANPRMVVEYFVECIEDYADHILQGDDAYFTGMNYNQMDMDDNYVKLSLKIKTIWSNITADQQEKIKRYFKLLVMLGAIAVRSERLRQVINKYRDPANPLMF